MELARQTVVIKLDLTAGWVREFAAQIQPLGKQALYRNGPRQEH